MSSNMFNTNFKSNSNFRGANLVKNMPLEAAASHDRSRASEHNVSNLANTNQVTTSSNSSILSGSIGDGDVKLIIRREKTVPEVKDMMLCRKQYDFILEKAKNPKVQIPVHDFKSCKGGHRHYMPNQWNNKPLCGYALSGLSCAFG